MSLINSAVDWKEKIRNAKVSNELFSDLSPLERMENKLKTEKYINAIYKCALEKMALKIGFFDDEECRTRESIIAYYLSESAEEVGDIDNFLEL